MVDLVKIRRKQKERREAEGHAEHQPESGPQDRGDAVVPSTVSAGQDPTPVSQPELRPESTTNVEAKKPKSTKPVPLSSEVTGEQSAPAQVGVSDKLERFRANAGRMATELAAVESNGDSETATLVELLSFVIGSEQYGLSIDSIVEIIPPRTSTRVPNSGEFVMGVLSLRGTIVTMVDVRGRLGHRGVAPGSDPRIIVVDLDGETLGFEVDRVHRVMKVAPDAIEPHPVVTQNETMEYIAGVCHQGKTLTVLLDLASLVRA